jgi:hypothetical protein
MKSGDNHIRGKQSKKKMKINLYAAGEWRVEVGLLGKN